MTEAVGWRDVRDAVAESETNILAALALLEKKHDDHEARLRSVEKVTGGAQAVLYAMVGAISAIGGLLAIAKITGII